MELERIKLLEELLKEAVGICAADFPFYGRIDTVWVGDKIDRIDKVDQRKIDRGKK